MPVSPRTPPGVLELLPAKQLAHQRMVDTIRRGFERFGFLPIETPAFEVADVLLTKSGGETEKQVYFVQSTGALEAGKPPELALRFDLTVPLARYVAEHESALNFPFRRYQIQRVYRGERNQKGRFREFYQCDIDVIARDTLALAYDAELPAIIHGIFAELLGPSVPFAIHINNRKLLRGLLESIGIAAELHGATLGELDRLGKLPPAEVETRLAAAGVAPEQARRLLETVSSQDDGAALLARLAAFPDKTPAFEEGLAELTRVYEGTLALGVPARGLRVDLRIARGLDYYTGTVYETFLDDHRGVGSICSGGRYENLAGHYTKSKLPGVGISIGLTRLFWQLDELGLLGAERASVAHAIVLNDVPALAGEYAAIARDLRAAGLNVEVYGGDDKLGKQFKYADKAKVPVAILLGAPEHAAGTVKLKDLRANAEHVVPRTELVARVRALVA
jgi:histidyl-tRNA synthetase